MKNGREIFFAILLLVFLVSAFQANAAYSGQRWSLGVFGGGGLGKIGIFQSGADDYKFYNVMGFASYRFSNLFETRVAGGMDGYYGISELFSWNSTKTQHNDKTVAVELGLLFHLLKNLDALVDPYLLTGIRVLGINPIIGSGFNIHLQDHIALFGEVDINSSIVDSKIEGRLGLKFSF